MASDAYIYIRDSDELPPLGSQDGKGDEAVAKVKLFTPDSSWTWWIIEYDPIERLAFGLVSGFEVELGYFSIEELEGVRGKLGLRIERDLHWEPKAIGEIKGKEMASK